MEPTKEELAAEQAAAQAPKEDELRAKIIEEFGFDETADAERIDKLVQREVESHKKLSQAIGQKIAHRKRAEELAKASESAAKEVKEVKEPQLSPKDFLALNEAKVTSEDFDEVLRVSKILDKPVAEALKDETLKAILEKRAEHRATAAATQTKSPRGAQQVTGESLLREAEKGNVPDSDADIAKMVAARLEAKTKK